MRKRGGRGEREERKNNMRKEINRKLEKKKKKKNDKITLERVKKVLNLHCFPKRKIHY